MGDELLRADYRVESVFERTTMRLISTKWYDEDGFNSAPADLPAETIYFANGKPRIEIWKKRGLDFREDDKPSTIHYSEKTGRPIHFQWHDTDERLDRRGDMPAVVSFNESSGALYVEFLLDGGPHRDDNKPNRIEYSSKDIQDGKFDSEWLQSEYLNLLIK